jgi:flagellar FliL protein
MSGGHTEKAGGDDALKKKGVSKLVLLALPVVLLAVVAGLWFSGILPGMLGMGKKPARIADAGMGAAVAGGPAKSVPATYLDVPEILTNLNVPGRRPSYLKLHAKLELGGAEDIVPVAASMPRILDLFQTYLRDMRPEELRGSEGTYRLREELLSRAEVAVAPAHVTDVLFEEMIVQ